MLLLKLLQIFLYVTSSQIDIKIVYIISDPTSQYLSKFRSLINNKKAYPQKESDLILFHIFGMLIALRGLMKTACNVYGVINIPSNKF